MALRRGRVLLVAQPGGGVLALPGGKVEPGEAPRDAARARAARGDGDRASRPSGCATSGCGSRRRRRRAAPVRRARGAAAAGRGRAARARWIALERARAGRARARASRAASTRRSRTPAPAGGPRSACSTGGGTGGGAAVARDARPLRGARLRGDEPADADRARARSLGALDRALADARRRSRPRRLADVLRAWQGLGYPRRARDLHACARRIASEGWPAPERSPSSPASAPTPPTRSAASPSSSRCCRATRTCAACWRGGFPGGVAPARTRGRSAGALMDVGRAHCRARPRCDGCPLRDGCLVALGGPAGTRPRAARRQAPYAGSLRARRGALLRAALAGERPPAGGGSRRPPRSLLADGLRRGRATGCSAAPARLSLAARR